MRNLITSIFAFFIWGNVCLSQSVPTYSQTVKIYHDVPFIAQPTGYSCWSTSIAMILYWKHNIRVSKSNLATAWVGVHVINSLPYWENYFGNKLSWTNQHPFSIWNFENVPPQSLSLEKWRELIEQTPLWLAYDPCYPEGSELPTSSQISNCGHAIVVVGMVTDGTYENTYLIIHDPDDGSQTYPNYGKRDQYIKLKDVENRLWSSNKNTPSSNRRVNFIAYPIMGN